MGQETDQTQEVENPETEESTEMESEVETETETETEFETETEPATEPETKETTAAVLDSTFEVHFIDVGQADAALVLCDGKAMLIDGGNAEDSSLMYSYLKKLNSTHLDYLIGTHAHEDHIGGLSGALNFATVGTVYCPVISYDTKAFTNSYTEGATEEDNEWFNHYLYCEAHMDVFRELYKLSWETRQEP